MSAPLPHYLKTYRKRAGLRQDELAFLLGTASGTKVSRYEQGRRKPSLETALAYRAVFGVSARTPEPERVLAIDPTHRGFGYVVMEGADRLVDWGLAEVSGEKYAACLKRVDRLIDLYQPTVMVLEDFAGPGSRRAPPDPEAPPGYEAARPARGLLVARYPRASVRKAFAPEGARTKEEIAAVIAARFPELAPRVPPTRKPWMSEDQRMAIFDAPGLAETYLR